MPLTPVPDDVFCTPMLQGGKDEQADGTFLAYPVSLQDIRDACCQLKSSLQLTGQASDILGQQLYSTGRVQTKAMRLGLEREDGAAQ